MRRSMPTPAAHSSPRARLISGTWRMSAGGSHPVLLSRLRISGKLALLVLIPVVAMLALAVPNSAQLIEAARRTNSTAATVRVASLTGAVVLELQEERLFS